MKILKTQKLEIQCLTNDSAISQVPHSALMCQRPIDKVMETHISVAIHDLRNAGLGSNNLMVLYAKKIISLIKYLRYDLFAIKTHFINNFKIECACNNSTVSRM